MPDLIALNNPDHFTKILYEKMKVVNLGIEDLELYEFQYALDNIVPEHGGWNSVERPKKEEIEALGNRDDFYTNIQLKPRVGDRIVLDEKIIWLTRVLFVGLVTGDY